MKLCPKCGKIAEYSLYFGAYICNNQACRWKDETPNMLRFGRVQIEILDKVPKKQYKVKKSEGMTRIPNVFQCARG